MRSTLLLVNSTIATVFFNMYHMGMQDIQVNTAVTMLAQPDAMQDARRGAKEDTRQQLLASQHKIIDNTPNSWLATNQLVKAKQAAVNTMMKMSTITKKKGGHLIIDKDLDDVPILKKGQTRGQVREQSTRGKKATTKTKKESTTVQNETTNSCTKQVIQTGKLCGCRHGDLSA
jgi:hypothetical protein